MAFLQGQTVHDRMKKTGFIMGPRHNMAPAMDDAAGAAPAASPDNNAGPPNLRDADGPESCGDCDHFDAAGYADDSGAGSGSAQCSQFQCNVTPNQVCDAFSPKGDADNGDQEVSPQGQTPAEARP
jgi:hypothetical protein